MELRNFIKETLRDILGGIEDAQLEIKNGVIVPLVNEENYDSVETGFTSYQKIEFEVAVNAVETKDKEAKLNVVTSVIGGGFGRRKSNTSENLAKLTFAVPVKLPPGEIIVEISDEDE